MPAQNCSVMGFLRYKKEVVNNDGGEMKTIILIVAILAISGFPSSCKIRASWVGARLDDLIYSWGPPVRERALADGRKVVEYYHSRQGGGTVTAYPGTNVAQISTSTYYCSAIISSEANGIINDVTFEGNIGGFNILIRSKSVGPMDAKTKKSDKDKLDKGN